MGYFICYIGFKKKGQGPDGLNLWGKGKPMSSSTAPTYTQFDILKALRLSPLEDDEILSSQEVKLDRLANWAR